mgnify:CR=1 FL=1
MSIYDIINESKPIDKSFYEKITFDAYIEKLQKNPKIARNAFQRLYDMINYFGSEEKEIDGEKVTIYKLFSEDRVGKGKDAVFGIEKNLEQLVNLIHSAAKGYGTEKRIFLLHGPVGSAKSTIARLLKKGLEYYSKIEEGELYTFEWLTEDDKWESCPLNEEPLKLLPYELREKVLNELNKKIGDYKISVEGDLCSFCRYYFNFYTEKYEGDWLKAIKEKVKVKRLIISEKDRKAIGTFQPKDEKNQDSTELTGDINYRKIAIYGSDSDPRAFNFDGEFCIANRGLIEFIEILKLDVAFLYDLLGASQEHLIKPKKFTQNSIDEVIIGHTNEPEYKKLLNNEYMEAFRDRTLRIDIPYNLKLSNEIKIYERDYGQNKIKGIHIAPYTIKLAAMWAVLTRLKKSKKLSDVDLIQKLKLYDGLTVSGKTADDVKALKIEGEEEKEGFDGISPRYIQDKIANALIEVSKDQKPPYCLNPFFLFNKLEEGLQYSSLIPKEKQNEYKELLAMVKNEHENILYKEVMKAISDESSIENLFKNYIEHVKAYNDRRKIKNKITGEDEEPNEKLMREIEEKMEIPDSRKSDFRRELMSRIGAFAVEGKRYDYKEDDRLYTALQLKLFDDIKDLIRLPRSGTGILDKEDQDKIDVIKSRLKSQYGYCEICATDALDFVSAKLAREEKNK